MLGLIVREKIVHSKVSHASESQTGHPVVFGGLCTLCSWGQKSFAASLCEPEAFGIKTWKQKEAEPLQIL